MGLVEEAVERVSFRTTLLFLVGSYVVYYVIQRLDRDRRLRRLGSRPPELRHWMPYGVDFVVRAIDATMNHRNVELWAWMFRDSPHYTAETTVIGRRSIFTADPENIKAILATQFGEYGKGQPFHEEWSPFLGDSIFTTDGAKWHSSRQLIRPQFVRDRISDLHTFEKHVQTLFKAMANGGPLNGEDQPVDMKAGNGKVIELSDLFFRYTLDVATDFLLGQDVKSLTTPVQEFAEAFNTVQRMQSVISRAGPLRPFVPKSGYNRGLRVMDDFVNVFIERALRLSDEELESKTKSDQGYTFLHELARFTKDRKILRDQLVAVLLAGRDTTAGTLSFALYELARQPEVVRKLRQEIAQVVGLDMARTPTYEHLKDMKYLQNIINETLRLYPAVPFNVRLALQDTTLPRGGGPDGSLPVAVLKDTPIAYSTLVMQRRPELYADSTARGLPHPGVFSPERWQSWQPRPWYYIPFNGGPRICIGQQFALTEMQYVLVRFFQRFERVESHMFDVDHGHPTLKSEIVIQPGDGVRVAFWEAG